MNALDKNLEPGTRVLVKAEFILPALRNSTMHRTFICDSGFGMSSFTAGKAIFGRWEVDGKAGRIEGFMIEREAEGVPTGQNARKVYKGLLIKTAKQTGGKAGKYNNKTSTVQVLDASGEYNTILKQIRYNVNDRESYFRAWRKAFDFVDARQEGK